ncbi:MAG: IS66 family insertion sequence element accessory protein TnpB [Burkholderiaceae bacterium]|nr:IS66 family insertion sequence element accessory protein TnpB [Burkholderiaceae bacterium]
MPEFIPLRLPNATAEAVATELKVGLRKEALSMTVTWPMHAAAHCALCAMGCGGAQVIRINAVWLAITPMDMRAGTETALARVVAVFGAAHPHTADLFANKRGTRLKVLVHDGMGIWLAARRLHQGRFHWHSPGGTAQQLLQREQLDALVLGLPWQRVGEAGVIILI